MKVSSSATFWFRRPLSTASTARSSTERSGCTKCPRGSLRLRTTRAAARTEGLLPASGWTEGGLWNVNVDCGWSAEADERCLVEAVVRDLQSRAGFEVSERGKWEVEGEEVGAAEEGGC